MRIIVAIVITVLVAPFALAQRSHTKNSDQSKLVFVIEPAKLIYAKGETIEFTFRLSNRSRNKVLVARTFQLVHFVTLEIVNTEGKQVDWCGRIPSQTDSRGLFVTLAPGESVSKKLIVSCVNREDRSRAWGYSLDVPGKYALRATYRLPQPEVFYKKLFPNLPAMRGPVPSQPVTIEIR